MLCHLKMQCCDLYAPSFTHLQLSSFPIRPAGHGQRRFGSYMSGRNASMDLTLMRQQAFNAVWIHMAH